MNLPALRRLVTIGLLLPLATRAQWEIAKLGDPECNTQGVALGPGIHEGGVGRQVSAASGWDGDGKGYQWTCTNPSGAWSARKVYSGLGVCYSPVVAALKGDGRGRLYTGSYSQRTVYEVECTDGVWTTAPVAGSTIDRTVCLRVAAGRNDGAARLSACRDAADADDDGDLDIADAVRALAYLFGGGAQLPPPFGVCGEDSTPDALECETPISCL